MEAVPNPASSKTRYDMICEIEDVNPFNEEPYASRILCCTINPVISVTILAQIVINTFFDSDFIHCFPYSNNSLTCEIISAFGYLNVATLLFILLSKLLFSSNNWIDAAISSLFFPQIKPLTP